MKSLLTAIGILSAALLAYEITLMQILSAMQWHHFAYMVISIALLGFGASGSFLALFRTFVLKHFGETFALSAFLCSVSMVVSYALSQYVRMDFLLIVIDPAQIWKLLLFYFLYLIPFFFGAICIGLALMARPEKSNLLYASNLIGSAAGGVLAVGLMYWISAETIPVVVAATALTASIFAVYNTRRKSVWLFMNIVAAFVVGIWLMFKPISLSLSQYKALSKTLHLPEARIIAEKTSPLGKLQAVTSPALRYAPGLSLNYTGSVPSHIGVFNNGEWAGAILNLREGTYNSSEIRQQHIPVYDHVVAAPHLDYSTSALPYYVSSVLKDSANHSRSLIIGAGTGSEVVNALQHHSSSVVGVEMNPQIIELVQDDFAAETGRLYQQKNVRIVAAEGRGFLLREDASYDIIVIPILEGFTASSAGLFAMQENFLFTVESFATILKHLNPEGVFAVSCWLKFPPRDEIKLLATLIEAMERCGYVEPAKHLVAIRGWISMTALIKQTPLDSSDVQSIRKFCETRSFDPIYYPGVDRDETNKYNVLESTLYHDACLSLFDEKREEYMKRYLFEINPATDNQPYFSHVFKWKSLGTLLESFGQRGTSFFELGYLILIVTAVQIAVFSLLFIFIPLLFLRRNKLHPSFTSFPLRRKTASALAYFAALGFGYMFVEVVFIQMFTLFLSHPVFSAPTVIGSMLLFSGLGSLFSEHLFSKLRLSLRRVLTILSIVILFYILFLPPVINSLLSTPNVSRFLLAAIIIAPISFCMGFPFPLGLKKLSKVAPDYLPWAWGINGCTSVIGVVLATLLAVEFGFRVVFLCALVWYLISMISLKWQDLAINISSNFLLLNR